MHGFEKVRIPLYRPESAAALASQSPSRQMAALHEDARALDVELAIDFREAGYGAWQA